MEKEYEIVDKLSKLLLKLIMQSNPPAIPSSYTSIESLQHLYTDLIMLRDFLYAASNGDLSMEITQRGYIAGTIKALQANLKHLTWQTKMVASGDFSQRVEFMGEFSESFNTMVTQLDGTLKELIGKEKELSRTNEELLKEIAIREKTEKALRESERALSLQAVTDSLTGLYNRRHFYKLAGIEVHKALRYLHPISVMMFDIDFFKQINDTYGHPAGDAVIKMIADISRKELRSSDILARYGGEEFIVMLPETSASNAFILGERLRKAIETETIETDNREISVTASFGISDYNNELKKQSLGKGGKILSELISNTDRALYASKNAGRNRVTIHQSEEPAGS